MTLALRTGVAAYTRSAASHTLTPHAGWAAGDLILGLFMARHASEPTLSLPAGWSALASSAYGTTLKGIIAKLDTDYAEEASWAFTAGGVCDWLGVVAHALYSDAEGGSADYVAGSAVLHATEALSTASIPAASVGAASDLALTLCGWRTGQAGSKNIFTGFTLKENVNDLNNFALYSAFLLDPAATSYVPTSGTSTSPGVSYQQNGMLRIHESIAAVSADYTIVNGTEAQLVNVNAAGVDVDPKSYKNAVSLTNTELAALLATAGVAVLKDQTGIVPIRQMRRVVRIAGTYASG